MLGRSPSVPPEKKIDVVGVKVAMFSFNRLANSDPTLSVDMMSTGEVACYGKTKEEAFLKVWCIAICVSKSPSSEWINCQAIQASGTKIPKKNIFLSFGGIESKQELLPTVKTLAALGYSLHGSIGKSFNYCKLIMYFIHHLWRHCWFLHCAWCSRHSHPLP